MLPSIGRTRSFELDLRAIGLFRIAVGIITLADQLTQSADHVTAGYWGRSARRED